MLSTIYKIFQRNRIGCPIFQYKDTLLFYFYRLKALKQKKGFLLAEVGMYLFQQ